MSHRLQLFDTPESLGETVASFLYDGYQSREHLLIIAKPRHLDAVCAALRRRGCFEPDMDGPQRLVALDAADVLREITRHGKIDPVLFHRTVRPIVHTLAAGGALRIYGEIVELLAEEENLEGALALEELWNDLRLELPFTLLCGYSSAHFARPAAREALQEICGCHHLVTAHADDTLGSYLLAQA